MILVDTNVVSEIMKVAPSESVVNWLNFTCRQSPLAAQREIRAVRFAGLRAARYGL